MTEDNTQSNQGECTCPQCGTKFTCGLAAMQATCWCFEKPKVITAAKASRQGCLCPDCLQKLIESIQTKQPS